MGTASWNFNSNVTTDEFVISGTQGELQFSVLNLFRPVQLHRFEKDIELIAFDIPEHVHQPMIQNCKLAFEP